MLRKLSLIVRLACGEIYFSAGQPRTGIPLGTQVRVGRFQAIPDPAQSRDQDQGRGRSIEILDGWKAGGKTHANLKLLTGGHKLTLGSLCLAYLRSR